MKKQAYAALVVAWIALASTGAGAAPITIDDLNAGVYDGVDVGFLDVFLEQRTQNQGPGGNSEDVQEAWVQEVLNDEETSWHVRDSDVPLYSTNQTGIYAFFMDDPTSEYFLVKNATQWALFENLSNLNWGVFDITQFTSDSINLPGNFVISHVTRFNPVTSVPEPASLALLGLGLVGIGILRRRRFSAA